MVELWPTLSPVRQPASREIWWQRGFRSFRNLRNIRHNTSFRSREWWKVVLLTMLMFAAFIGAILGLAALLANRLP